MLLQKPDGIARNEQGLVRLLRGGHREKMIALSISVLKPAI